MTCRYVRTAACYWRQVCRCSWSCCCLIGASLMSWSIIFTKRRLIQRTKDASDEFEASFWSGGDLNTLYQQCNARQGWQHRHGAASSRPVFGSSNAPGSRTARHVDKLVEECRRAMRVAQMREVDRLEQGLATLATIGSTSPYVGLFGTVWGIMNAFMGSATCSPQHWQSLRHRLPKR